MWLPSAHGSADHHGGAREVRARTHGRAARAHRAADIGNGLRVILAAFISGFLCGILILPLCALALGGRGE